MTTTSENSITDGKQTFYELKANCMGIAAQIATTNAQLKTMSPSTSIDGKPIVPQVLISDVVEMANTLLHRVK